MAAHRVQPTSDMIIWSRIRASRAGEASPKYAAHSSADLRLVVAEFLAGIAELEGRIGVAAVLPVHDPQPIAVVEVVLGQQVVMAWHGCGTMRHERGLDPREQVEMLPVAGRDRDVAVVDEGQVALGQAEHVEVVPEAGSGVEPAERAGDAGGHPGCRQRFVRHRPRRQPLEHEHAEVGQAVDDSRTDARSGRGQRVVQLVRAIDGQEFGGGARDPDEIGDRRRSRPGSWGWSGRP